MKDMDFPFIRHNDENFDLKDLFETRLSKSTCETMNWPSSTDDMLESIFPMDFLNNINDQESFCGLEDFSEHIKMEAEDYEITAPTLPEPLLSQKSDAISSNSSDSGLSSDNLEVEMSPPYEPLSPSPRVAKIPECGVKRQQQPQVTEKCPEPMPKKLCTNEHKPKVIVQKVPQVMTLNSTIQATNTTNTQPQRTLQQLKPSSQTLVNGVRGNEIKIVKLSPQMFTTPNKKPVTIQVKNSNSGAKIQAKPGTLFLNSTKLSEMKKYIRVHNSNPRSVLIPVSMGDVKELRSFKIVNTTASVRPTPAKVPEPSETNDHFQFLGKSNDKDDSFMDNSSDCDSIIIEDGYNNDDYVHDPEASYPKLQLTSEEKRLLSKEGITLPSHYPLTKHEERELKRIRRKIRNKISAQDSRKRKKEYVDGLEERVKQCTEENQTLMKRIKQLQSQNQNLMSQMKKLQTLLTKGTNKTTQPTTCLMVLLLSLALVAAPNLKLGQNAKESDLEEAVQETILQNRRSLLFENKGQSIDVFDEEVNMSDIVSPISECESVVGRNSNTKIYPASSKCKKMNLVHPEFIDNVDDGNWYTTKNHVETNAKSFANYELDNKDHFQTSGFNIERESPVKMGVESEHNSWLDKDILEMVTPTANGLFELNMDKIVGGDLAGIPDMPAKHVYTNEVNINNSSSGVRQIKEY